MPGGRPKTLGFGYPFPVVARCPAESNDLTHGAEPRRPPIYGKIGIENPVADFIAVTLGTEITVSIEKVWTSMETRPIPTTGKIKKSGEFSYF